MIIMNLFLVKTNLIIVLFKNIRMMHRKKCLQQKHFQQPIFLKLCRKQFDVL